MSEMSNILLFLEETLFPARAVFPRSLWNTVLNWKIPQEKLRVSLNPVLPRLLFIYCLKIVWLKKWGPSLFLSQLFLPTPTGFEEMAATIVKNIICSHLLFFRLSPTERRAIICHTEGWVIEMNFVVQLKIHSRLVCVRQIMDAHYCIIIH